MTFSVRVLSWLWLRELSMRNWSCSKWWMAFVMPLSLCVALVCPPMSQQHTSRCMGEGVTFVDTKHYASYRVRTLYYSCVTVWSTWGRASYELTNLRTFFSLVHKARWEGPSSKRQQKSKKRDSCGAEFVLQSLPCSLSQSSLLTAFTVYIITFVKKCNLQLC